MSTCRLQHGKYGSQFYVLLTFWPIDSDFKLTSLSIVQNVNTRSLHFIYINPFVSAETNLPTHRTARILWVSFWFMSLVIVTTYAGNLVAALTTQHVKLPFRNLEELADDKEYSLTTRRGSSVQALFEVCVS